MVKEEKIKEVDQLKGEIESYEVFGILDMHKMPSKQYQEIQKQIRDIVEIKMIKKSTLARALAASSKPNIKELEKLVPKQPAIIFTKMNPFKFYVRVAKLKSPTYAKEGDIADDEIMVSAGPTGLMPGPVISEFSKVGIPAGVEEGKIAIKRDKIVAKKNDAISKDLANILRKLKIKPTKIGLNVVALYDKGIIYLKNVLELAGQAYVDQILQAHQHAINLSVGVGYPTKENIKLLLVKAYRQSQAIESKIKMPEPVVAQPQAQPEQAQTETPKNEQTQTQDSQVGGKN